MEDAAERAARHCYGSMAVGLVGRWPAVLQAGRPWAVGCLDWRIARVGCGPSRAGLGHANPIAVELACADQHALGPLAARDP